MDAATTALRHESRQRAAQAELHDPRLMPPLRDASTHDKFPGPLVPLGLGLTAIVVYSKWLLLPFPVQSLGEFVSWALRLAIVASADVCFVLGLVAVCAVASVLARRWPIATALWRPTQLVIFILAAWYALVGVAIFQIMMVPLTVRLLTLAGHPSVMLSSIREYLAPGPLLAMIAAPLALIALAHATRRFGRPLLSARWRRPVWLTVFAVVPLYGLACQRYIETHWTDPNRWERRIAYSPHAVFLASCIEELHKGGLGRSSFLFGNADESDFIPAARHEANEHAASAASMLPAERRPQNVVYIVMESVAAQYVSFHGSPHQTMPRLARRAAAEGVVFENAYVQAANSCKSLVALLAGVYPRPDWRLIVRDFHDFDVPRIDDVLRDAGYRTCFAHAGRWSWKHRDQFLRHQAVDALIDAESLGGPMVSSWGIADRRMFQASLDWIDAEPDRPFFLFTYTIETHHPYVMPPRPVDFGVDDEEFNRYLNALRAADETIDWFLEELGRRGLAESTVVVVTSDHGENFGQHGRRFHNFDIYEASVHVPLVMLHPALREAGLSERERGVCQHLDVAPTLLDLLGMQSPAPWQGRSLLADRSSRRAYFMATGNHIPLGLRDGDWKYHYYTEDGREDLFHLASDPGERENLAPREPDRCQAYRRRIGGLVRFQQRYLAQHGSR